MTFPGMRRPSGGTGRDLAVCPFCGGKFDFFYEVGDVRTRRARCPGCAKELELPGFRSWEEPAPPGEEGGEG
jgi:hypothetical protein